MGEGRQLVPEIVGPWPIHRREHGFFRVEDEIVRMRTESATFQVEYSLSDLAARLPDPPSFRAHRSVMVNLRKIREIAPMLKGSYVLIMEDKEGSEIQVSERQSKYVRDLLRA